MSQVEKPLRDMEFVAFDLETTGLHPVASHIVEIGAVRFRGDGTLLDQFHQLVNPQSPIPPDVTAIHRITDEMVRDEPTIGESLPRLVDFLGEAPILMLAHNAGFDLGFLSVAFSRLRRPCPAHPVIDTWALARRRLSLPNYKLETIGRHLRLIDAEKHRALDDAVLLKDVFLTLIKTRPAIHNTSQLYRLAPQLSFDRFAAVIDVPLCGYEELWAAIGEEASIMIEYFGGSNPGATRTVTPLGVIDMRGQVYLSAYCHQSDCDKTFRLDRIGAFRRVS